MDEKQFKNKFLQSFASGVSKEKLDACYVNHSGGYLWHIFSFKLVNHLSGDSARAEFDKIDKEGATEILYLPYKRNGLFSCKKLQPNHGFSAKIETENLCEFYVIGKNFSWVYIVTHEGDYCGPYFAYAFKK